jgi:hypothetical protein
MGFFLLLGTITAMITSSTTTTNNNKNTAINRGTA